ncbi:hypothetical protein F8568_014700 [Actinomadura sp. LD22]|uniref:CoA transferase n=1 Tax=Actinomadura physcomitrii TaxID=2650748 RepID=A0A6I4M7K0_9ACTN|nr:CoA transferase [Actinomadura physcomitrii]MWA01602.1 hypothetical protein [Actinomadura physcomitrii]
MLTDLKVLELSAPDTMLGGRILADFGADVVVVEPPAGAAGRRLGPFAGEYPGIEQSLSWQSANIGKRGVTLDVASVDGQALLQRLLQDYDVLLEAPGPAPATPVGARCVLPERTVHCVIRPFAETGPKSAYAATDLVLAASSGALGPAGDRQGPPPVAPVPQTRHHAGAEAAIAVLAAVAARDRDGLGQRAAVSARIAAALAGFTEPIVVGAGAAPGARATGNSPIPGVFQCRDGYVQVTIAFGPSFGPMTARLAQWLLSRGDLTAEEAAPDWAAIGSRPTPRGDPAAWAALGPLVRGVVAACAALTRREVEDAAREQGFLAACVDDMGDVARSDFFSARGLWGDVEVTTSATGETRTIAAPLHFPRVAGWTRQAPRRAPRLGEHNAEVYGSELGLAPPELEALFVHGII